MDKAKVESLPVQELLDVGAALGSHKTIEGVAYAVIPPGYKLEDLEKFQTVHLSAPRRARGGLSLGDVPSFIRFVNKHKDIAGSASQAMLGGTIGEADPDDMQTVILVDVINSRFRAVFNHHASDAPGHADHHADYNCPLSKEWQIWNDNNGKTRAKSQEEFAFFIEQNLLDIVDPVGATMLQTVTSLKATKNVQFDSALRLADGQVQIKYHEEAKATAGEAGQLTIPEKIALGIPVYVGAANYRVEAHFRYRIEGSRLLMWYDLIAPHKILEHALAAVTAEIAEGTKLQPYSVTSFS